MLNAGSAQTVDHSKKMEGTKREQAFRFLKLGTPPKAVSAQINISLTIMYIIRKAMIENDENGLKSTQSRITLSWPSHRSHTS